MDELVARIMARIEYEPNTGCWLWPGGQQRYGYGSIGYRGLPTQKVHRVMFFHAYPDADRSLNVCHKCDTPPCCNPTHLFLGTQYENMQDMARKNRHPKVRGSKNGNCRFTPEQIAEIRAEYRVYPKGKTSGATPGSIKSLALKYGRSMSTIGKIVHRQTYQDLP